jgi:predicted outer membrane repeat protein
MEEIDSLDSEAISEEEPESEPISEAALEEEPELEPISEPVSEEESELEPITVAVSEEKPEEINDEASEITALADGIDTFAELNGAITAASSNDTITITGDITLDSTIAINGKNLNFTSEGGPWHLYVGGNYRHFNLTNTTVDFDDLTLTRAPGYTGDSDFGGGLFTQGNVTLTDGTISGNFAPAGGGVYVSSGSFNMSGGLISSNVSNSIDMAASGGGGIFAYHGTSINISGLAKISENRAYLGGGIGGRSRDGNLYSSTYTLTMSSGSISNNIADFGGGIYAEDDFVINLSGSASINDNKAMENVGTYSAGTIRPCGGGVYATGSGVNRAGTLTMSGSARIIDNEAEDGAGIRGPRTKFTMSESASISGNKASGQGGGYLAEYNYTSSDYNLPEGTYADCSFTLNGGSIDKNSATSGGGIYIGIGSFPKMNGGVIENNEADNGGGVYVHGYSIGNRSIFTATGGNIRGNKATQNGGGLYVDTAGTIALTTTTLTNNSAENNGGGIYTEDYSILTADTNTVFSGNTSSSTRFISDAENATLSTYSRATDVSVPAGYILNIPTGYNYNSYNNNDINYDGLPAVSLTYKGNENGSGSVPSIPILTGEGNSLTTLGNSNNLVKANNTFTGWNTAANGSGTSYSAGSAITLLSSAVLYAQYELNKYAVTFKDHDGTVLKTQTVSHGSAASAPTDPTRVGYTFTGWDKTFSNVTSEFTANAQYEINSYTVTFKDYNGSTLKTETVAHGAAATAPANPSRSGYTFTGWDKTFSNVTSEFTVNAQYEIIPTVVTPVTPETPEKPATPVKPTTPVTPAKPTTPTTPETPTVPTTPETPVIPVALSDDIVESEVVEPEVVELDTTTSVVPEPTEPEESAPAVTTPANYLAQEIKDTLSISDQKKLEAQTGNIARDLLDGNVPRGNFGAQGVWSLLNLILAFICLVSLGITLLGIFRRNEYQGIAKILRVVSAGLAAMTFIAWIILDKLHSPTVWIDQYTGTIVALFVATVIVTVVFNLTKKNVEMAKAELNA